MFARFFRWSVFCLLGYATIYTSQSAPLTIPFHLSNEASVSLLTCAPGTDEYALFGHSALRIYDPVLGINQVYNYGTFDSRTPFFLWHFLRGDLQYWLSSVSFDAFLYAYQLDNRAITEQVLALQPAEIQVVFERLETTLQSPAKYYQYQFFADNCSTRLVDVINKSLLLPVDLDSTHQTSGPTYRALLAPYIRQAPWVNLGVNLSLGWYTDQPVSYRQRLFLPTELQQAMAKATRRQQRFVARTNQLFSPTQQVPEEQRSWFTPTILFLGLALLVLFTENGPFRQSRVSRIINAFLLTIIGLIGCFILGVNLFTLHQPLQVNYQLMWILPTHILVVFARPTPLWRRYAICSLILLIIGGLVGGWLYYRTLLPEVFVLQAGILILLFRFFRGPLVTAIN